MPKMATSHPHRTSSSDSDSIRKRVGKACDRCRLKKSKCDGSSPCSRCKADNAICVFGERKKSHDKVYPKGYVEMLEQQQSQLVAGLQETYRRLQSAQLWPGAALTEHNGSPLTHDILAGLDLLEPKQDGSGEMEEFEEDCHKLQQRLVLDGAPYVGRRGSFSSESDHDHSHRHVRNSSHSSFQETPTSSQAQPVFAENWKFETSPSPVLRSPSSKVVQPRPSVKPSPLSNESVNHDDLFTPPWSLAVAYPEAFARPQFSLPTSTTQDNIPAMMAEWATQGIDNSFDNDNGAVTFNPQYAGQQYAPFNSQDWLNGPMDADFNTFVQVPT